MKRQSHLGQPLMLLSAHREQETSSIPLILLSKFPVLILMF
jgi:hypothetical protein